MTRTRSHRRRGAAGLATARTGGIRQEPGTYTPRTADVPPAAPSPWPTAKPRGLAPTLVLLTLLLLAVSTTDAAYDAEVEAVQRALTERGYNPGTIDGAMGWRTRGALREFQRSAGIPDTGLIDDPTRTALELAPGDGTKPPPAGDANSTGAEGAARTESAAEPETTAPKAVPARTELVIVPDADAPKAEPAQVEPTAVPEAAAPKAVPVSPEPVIVPDTDASNGEPTRAVPAAVPEAAAPEVEAARTEPATAPQAPARTTEATRPESTPVRTPRPKLDFAMLGWHRPQTGAEARARFDAIGAPPEFRRGKSALFVPKGEFVFVLKAGERFPGLDCDPGAGRLSIEFVFGPDGPAIFTPAEGGEFCQAGIGIAIEVGRTLEIRRVDWGDMQLPPGTVRVTGQGLEYVR